MFINIQGNRINTDYIISYAKRINTKDGVFIQLIDSEVTINNVDVEKTLLQLDRILNPKHIDIFEVKK